MSAALQGSPRKSAVPGQTLWEFLGEEGARVQLRAPSPCVENVRGAEIGSHLEDLGAVWTCRTWLHPEEPRRAPQLAQHLSQGALLSLPPLHHKRRIDNGPGE